MKQKNKTTLIILSTLLCIALLAGFCFAALNQQLHTVSYTIHTNKIEKTVRLMLLTDLHGSFYGKDQEQLLDEIKKCSPDLLLFAGDIFDEDTDHSAAEVLLQSVSKDFPCYYVTGNHEYAADFSEIKEILDRYKVKCLWGESAIVTVNGQQLFLAGIADLNHSLYFESPTLPDTAGQFLKLEEERKEHDALFSILLCHRPSHEIVKTGAFDLSLSGHIHGGQVRVPGIINGLFSPDEGFFPKYAGGLYTLNDTSCLIIGRGLAKNHIPRVFNRPELVCIDILPTA